MPVLSLSEFLLRKSTGNPLAGTMIRFFNSIQTPHGSLSAFPR